MVIEKRLPQKQKAQGDNSALGHILEIVMNMQMSMGKLTEAVESLKGQVREHGGDIRSISTDIHTAKTTIKTTAKIVGWILAAFLAFSGWVINKAVDAYTASHQSNSSPIIRQ